MPSTPTPIVAQSASAFDQSIGVNLHTGSASGSYTNVALVESDLAYLGVVNVRDNLVELFQSRAARCCWHQIRFHHPVNQSAGRTLDGRSVCVSQYASLIYCRTPGQRHRHGGSQRGE